MSSGDIIGVDLKKVTPLTGEPWYMLLAVDFCSNKVWTWDLDCEQIKLEHVQERLLKFYATEDLPCAVWSDNGGQFRTVVAAALKASLGVNPRYIPPGRPQANGLTEGFHKVMDASHGGVRARLVTATIAVNNKVNPKFGVSSESVYRRLRPLESRWHSLALKGAIHGARKELTHQEWLDFPAEADQRSTTAALADKLEEDVGPIRDAIHSAHCRSQLQKRLN